MSVCAEGGWLLAHVQVLRHTPGSRLPTPLRTRAGSGDHAGALLEGEHPSYRNAGATIQVPTVTLDSYVEALNSSAPIYIGTPAGWVILALSALRQHSCRC